MTGCLESTLASPVLAQSWSQTATMEPGSRQRHSRVAMTDHDVYAFYGLVVPSLKLDVQERNDLPSEQQPPRGARQEWGARPLPTANVAGCINALICPTSIEHSASTYVVREQSSVGGSPA